MIKCNRCGTYTLDVETSDSFGSICVDCMIDLNPEVMIISNSGESDYLWNETCSRYEGYVQSIKTFEKCGWFIREKKSFDAPDGIVRTVFKLERTDTAVKCYRAKSLFKYMSSNTPFCTNVYCAINYR